MLDPYAAHVDAFVIRDVLMKLAFGLETCDYRSGLRRLGCTFLRDGL